MKVKVDHVYHGGEVKLVFTPETEDDQCTLHLLHRLHHLTSYGMTNGNIIERATMILVPVKPPGGDKCESQPGKRADAY